MDHRMDTRFCFSPVYSAWNKLSVHYQTNCIDTKHVSNQWIRTVAPVANITKKALIRVAFVIDTLVMAIFSICILPYRLYRWKKMELQRDFNRLSSDEQTRLEQDIRDYIDIKEIKGKFHVSSLEKDEIVYHAMCYFARSQEIYGPVTVAWVEYLLEKANSENKKLIFMARDGIAPYKLALAMMEKEDYQKKYPNLVGENKIALAYFSRKLVDHAMSSTDNKQLFREYVKQLGMQDGDQCVLVDIGFTGSMIDKLRGLLPDVDLSFDYLISHTDAADGFIYSSNDPRLQSDEFAAIPSIQSISYKGAGSNYATHWLEDSHQGTTKSAKKLVKIDGVIYPDTIIPHQKEYIVTPGSHDFIIRKWASKAIQRSLQKYSAGKRSKAEIVKNLDETLKEINEFALPLLIKHI